MNINGFTSKASARRAIRAKFPTFNSTFADPLANPKVAKNGKIVGVMTAPLHLAPARSSGFQTCPMATAGCIAACLNTAGNPAYLDSKLKSRIVKTQAYIARDTRPAFVSMLAFEIVALVRKAAKAGMEPAVRLNATSTLPGNASG